MPLPGFDTPQYRDSDTTRGEWADGVLDIYSDIKYPNRSFSTFGSVCVSERGKKVYEYTGDHTEFGFSDPIDNGWGTPALGTGCIRCGIINGGNNSLLTSHEGSIGTNNRYIRGVAMPQAILNEIIGTDLAAQRRARVEVSYYDPNTKITICRSFPIVDYGPGEYVYSRTCHAVIDMTKKAAQELGIQGKSHQIPLVWNIIPEGGEDPNTGQRSGRIELPDDYFNVTDC